MRSALRLAPALLWAALIWRLSSQPALFPPLFPGADKVFHLLGYAGFGLLLGLAAAPGTAALTRFRVALGAGYGLIDELHQYWIPGRSTEAGDALADLLGVMLGLRLWDALTRSGRGGTR